MLKGIFCMSNRLLIVVDYFLAILLLPLVLLLFFLILILKILGGDIGLFIQHRVGLEGEMFALLKVRTMKKGTRSAGTHEIPESSVTTLGGFFRKTKLDELPQIFNVLLGDMSFVGPRPGLPNQLELISERNKRGIFRVKPGITGLAQIRKIDMSDPVVLAITDEEMIKDLSVGKYVTYILITIWSLFPSWLFCIRRY